MDDIAVKLREKLTELQDEIEQGLEEKRAQFHYHLEKRRVVFEQEVAERHRALKLRLLKFLARARFGAIVTAPVIYSLIIPIALLDVFVTVYQHICFRVYRVPLVRRSEYVVMDRKYLGYLNVIEKLNCVYCEYANGVISYVREVAGRTEQFWCPIKHARKVKDAHARYYEFIEYGDGEDFHKKLRGQRDKCRACEMSESCSSGRD